MSEFGEETSYWECRQPAQTPTEMESTCSRCAALEAEVARLTAEKEHATRCCLGQLDAKLAREKELIATRALLRELAAAVRARREAGSAACYADIERTDAQITDLLRRAEAEAGDAR